MTVEQEADFPAAQTSVYSVSIADRYCGNPGTLRSNPAVLTVTDGPITRMQFLDLKYLDLEGGNAFEFHIRQGTDSVYSHTETDHLMLRPGKPLDSGGIENMQYRMVADGVFDPGGILLEHPDLSAGEIIHRRILGDTQM